MTNKQLCQSIAINLTDCVIIVRNSQNEYCHFLGLKKDWSIHWIILLKINWAFDLNFQKKSFWKIRSKSNQIIFLHLQNVWEKIHNHVNNRSQQSKYLFNDKEMTSIVKNKNNNYFIAKKVPINDEKTMHEVWMSTLRSKWWED